MAILSLLTLAGYSKPPTKEIEAADKAVSEARQKEADLYSQYLYSKADETLELAKDFVAAKKYKEAKAAV